MTNNTRSSSSKQFREGPRKNAAISDIGGAIGRKLGFDVLASVNADTQNQKNLVGHYSCMADFTNQLKNKDRQGNEDEPTRVQLDCFFENLIGGIDIVIRRGHHGQQKVHSVSASIFDKLFLIYGITALNGGFEMEVIATKFKNRAEFRMGSQAIAEISWMNSSFWGKIQVLKATFPKIAERVAAINETGKNRAHAAPRPGGAEIPFIGRIMDQSSRNVAFARKPAYLENARFMDIGSASGQSINSSKSPDPDVSRKKGPRSRRPQYCAGDSEANAPDSGGSAPASDKSAETSDQPVFFIQRKAAASMEVNLQSRSGNKHVLGDFSSALPKTYSSFSHKNFRVDDFLQVESNPNMYLYGELKVAAGLQPVLLHEQSLDGKLLPPFYRLKPAGSQTAEIGSGMGSKLSPGAESVHGTDIVKVFPRNGTAWEFLEQQASGRTVLQAGSFYLIKVRNETWLPVFSTAPKFMLRNATANLMNGPANIPEPRNLLCWYISSYAMFGMHLEENHILPILHLLFWGICYNLHEEGDDIFELSDKEHSLLVDHHRSARPDSSLLIKLSHIVMGWLRNSSSGSDPEARESFQKYIAEEKRQCEYLLRTTQRFHKMEDETESVHSVLREQYGKQLEQRNGALELGDMDGGDGEHTDDLAFVRPANEIGQDAELTDAGDRLAELLVELANSNLDLMRRHLTHVLQAFVANRNNMLVEKQKITKKRFREKSDAVTSSVKQSNPGETEAARWFFTLPDSDDEDDDAENPYADDVAGAGVRHAHMGSVGLGDDDGTNLNPEQAEKQLNASSRDQKKQYPDTVVDRSADRLSLLRSDVTGYPRCVNNPYVVLNAFDDDMPFYNVKLEHQKQKIRYSDNSGLVLSYLIHKDILEKLLTNARDSKGAQRELDDSNESSATTRMVELREKLLKWISNVLRSPISANTKTWFLKKLQSPDSVSGKVPCDPKSNLNLAIILHCLLRLCPSTTAYSRSLKNRLRDSLELPTRVEDYIQRKSGLFGVYIVKGGTLSDLKRLGVCNISEVDYSALLHQHGMKKMLNHIYFDIIGRFSKFCFIVYVRGITKIDDKLLKWLAEYTRFNPWQFVYLENVDICWNFSENRDRCVCDFAPTNPAHVIHGFKDLRESRIKDVRPTHHADYSEVPDAVPAAQDVKSGQALMDFLRERMCGAGDIARRFFGSKSAGRGRLISSCPANEEPDLAFVRSRMNGDFRETLDRHLLGTSSPRKSAGRRPKAAAQQSDKETLNLILLVSPPGAGKTFHMEQMMPKLQALPNVATHDFDCSSDILATHTLLSQLNKCLDLDDGDEEERKRKKMADADSDEDDDMVVDEEEAEEKNQDENADSGSMKRNILVLDEYHFLEKKQKDEPFKWHNENPSTTMVLIANRIDARDRMWFADSKKAATAISAGTNSSSASGSSATNARTACPTGRLLIETRLTHASVREVMRNGHSIPDGSRTSRMIVNWMTGSRLVFGAESISLRMIGSIQKAIAGNPAMAQASLERMLLDKVPTISRVSAEQFVGAFLTENGMPGVHGDGASGVLYRVALLDERDEFCSIPELIDRFSILYQHPPVVRLFAWVGHILHATKSINSVAEKIDFSALLAHAWVDQVGFPFQLRDSCENQNRGVAFSWGGDYRSMSEMSDALRRGHSIDFEDVAEKQWSRNDITEPDEFIELLCAGKSAAKILRLVQPRNLCTLMQNSKAETSIELAKMILRYQVGASLTKGEHQPFAWAAWVLIRSDESIRQVADLQKLTDGDAQVQDSKNGSTNVGPASSAARSGSQQAIRATNLLRCMLWAQEHAYPHRETRLDTTRRDRLLKEILKQLSLDSSIEDDHLGKLWTGEFAVLLELPECPRSQTSSNLLLPSVSGTSGSRARGSAADSPGTSRESQIPSVQLPIDVFCRLMQVRPDADPKWPGAIRDFWSLLNHRADVRTSNDLWTNNRYLFFDKQNPTALNPTVVQGLVGTSAGEGGNLDCELQKAMIMTNSIVHRDILVGNFKRAVEDGLRMTPLDQIKVQHEDPNFMEELRKEAQSDAS